MANKIPRVPVREQDPQIRATNFEEVCYGYDLDEARLEASRCLHCRNPRCVAACPVSIRIPDFIGALHTGDRRRALRENKKLSYLYALADLRENLLDWFQFDPEQQALQIGADAGALTGLLARRLSSVTVLDVSEENLEVVRRRFQTEPELAAKIRYVCADVETYAREAEKRGGTYGYVVLIGDLTAADRLPEVRGSRPVRP